jgi:signal transduction histidine kinase/Tfp pilus assembly protein PilF
MPKSGFHIAFFCFLLLLNTSCKEKTPVSISLISSDPRVQEVFNSFLNYIEADPGTNDSLVYHNYYKSKSILDDDGLLLLYRKMGEYFYNNEIPDSALIYFNNGLKLAKQVENVYYISVFHMMLGSVFTFVSDFEPALIELKSAYNLSLTIDSLRLQVRTSRNLGNVYWNIGNYDLALDYYLISLDISQKSDNKLGIASALNNIGNVYQEVKDYNRAIEYYTQSAVYGEKYNFERLHAICTNNLGDVYSIQGRYDSALIYFKKALVLLEKDDSRFDAGIYIGNIADVYLKTDSLEKAKQYFHESLKFATETGDKTGIASCNLGLADVHLNEKDAVNALEYLNNGTKISEEIGSLKLLDYAYKLNSKYYLQKNNFPDSHRFLSKQMAIKDSIYSLENGENVARLENQYKEIKSIKEIELLKEKQKAFLYTAIIGFSAFIIISLLILMAYRQKTRSNTILKEKNLQIEKSSEILEEKNQQLLKSQELLNIANKGKDDFLTIISHDLKNPLSSIRGFTELLVQNYDSLSDEKRKLFLNEVFNSIERISLLITNVLFWVKSQTDGIHFKPEKFNLNKRVDDNISIYRLITSNKEIEIENKVSGNINVIADINVFDMIVRNILSNALKFTNAKGRIEISSKPDGEKIKLIISDNGIGIPEDKLKLILHSNEQYTTTGTRQEQGTGLGLGLTYKFIEQTGGNFEITSIHGKGTTVAFSLDISI